MSRKALAAVVLLACCLVAFTALSAGVSVTPVAFLSAGEERVEVLPAAESDAYAKLARLLPQLLEAAGDLITSLTAGGSAE